MSDDYDGFSEFYTEKPFKGVQFVHLKKDNRVVGCYYGKMHVSLSQIFRISRLHQIYHEYLKNENEKRKTLGNARI